CARLLLRGTDGATVAQFTVVDADIEPAAGIAARPGFVRDRRAVAAVVAQRQERANLAFATRGPFGWRVHSLPTSLSTPHNTRVTLSLSVASHPERSEGSLSRQGCETTSPRERSPLSLAL